MSMPCRENNDSNDREMVTGSRVNLNEPLKMMALKKRKWAIEIGSKRFHLMTPAVIQLDLTLNFKMKMQKKKLQILNLKSVIVVNFNFKYFQFFIKCRFWQSWEITKSFYFETLNTWWFNYCRSMFHDVFPLQKIPISSSRLTSSILLLRQYRAVNFKNLCINIFLKK